MPNSHRGRTSLRLIILVTMPALLALALAAAPAVARAHVTVSLNPVGSRYVGDLIPIKGYTAHAPRGKHKLKLQAYSGSRWVTRATKYVRNGPYRFPSQAAAAPGIAKFRTALFAHGRRIGVSNVIAVTVAARPAPAPAPPPPTPTPAGPPVLPDLRIKDLTKCGAGDMARTGGTCFMIDTTSIPGTKMLKFGVVTLNLGNTPGQTGPAEIVAHRSSPSSTDWQAQQNFYDLDGHPAGSVSIPGLEFYYATDGHSHWHIKDFDDYSLLDASGTQLRVGEKHGFCIQDNTTWDPWQGLPRVPSTEVYTEAGSCGKGQPDATSIVHGVSVGWGDTYPTTLPDQGIDVTGLPDGVYTVRVHADGRGAVQESNETNNTATVKVNITGNTVSVVPGSSAGGM